MRIGDVLDGYMLTVEPCHEWPLGRWERTQEVYARVIYSKAVMEERMQPSTPPLLVALPGGFVVEAPVPYDQVFPHHKLELKFSAVGLSDEFVKRFNEGQDYVAAMTPITDIPGIVSHAAKQAALPPPVPAASPAERVAPSGINRTFGFDHRNGTGGTHGCD